MNRSSHGRGNQNASWGILERNADLRSTATNPGIMCAQYEVCLIVSPCYSTKPHQNDKLYRNRPQPVVRGPILVRPVNNHPGDLPGSMGSAGAADRLRFGSLVVSMLRGKGRIVSLRCSSLRSHQARASPARSRGFNPSSSHCLNTTACRRLACRMGGGADLPGGLPRPSGWLVAEKTAIKRGE